MLISGAGVSPKHCRIWLSSEINAYLIKDLGSECGTLVKIRSQLHPGEPTFPDAEVVIGEYQFKVKGMSDTGSSSPRLRFESPIVNFETNTGETTIGSNSTCDVVLPNLLPLHAKVLYSQGSFFTSNPSDSAVYKKLRLNEVAQLQPGSIFQVGKLLFEAARYNVARWAEKGSRDTMEDADIAVQNLFVFDGVPVSFYAIYDGHGGAHCARFLQAKLHNTFRAHLQSQMTMLHAHFPLMISQVFRTSFAHVDSEFYRQDRDMARSVGSTAIVCVVAGNQLICGNLGDSRAVLSRKGQAIDLSSDHKPVIAIQSAPNELARIQEKGGYVYQNRLFGRLAVSRSFGDFEFKDIIPEELGVEDNCKGPFLSIEPDIRAITLRPLEDEFLIIACDGLWDVYSSQEAVTTIRKKLLQTRVRDQDPQRIARDLISDAIYKRGSRDNITVLLVMLACGLAPPV